MKNYIYYITLFCCFLFAGCSDDNEETIIPIVEFQQNEITNIPYQGQTYEIVMTTEAEWTAKSLVDWCTMLTTKGNGNRTLVFNIEANLGESRQGEIVVYSQEEQFTIKLQQQKNEIDGEFRYHIPVVFHVIYNDEFDVSQNPSAEVLYGMLNEVNSLYSHASNNSMDLNMEFVLAEYDPQGNKLKEAGIDRIYWPQEKLDPTTVMEDKTGQYTHFIWEPNEYINILIYPFSISSILGISTFPYNPAEDSEHWLAGLESVSIGTTLENLNYVHGISLNSLYLKDVEDVFVKYVKDPAMKVLMNKQSELYITLAHELGHYLGLRHTFSEVSGGWLADTDLCSDTGSYIRSGTNGYEAQLNKLLEKIQTDPSFAESYDWESLFWRDGDANFGRYQAHNIMDYSYCYLDEFTQQQRDRVRFVLEYSPLIPGPKKTQPIGTRSVRGIKDLPVTLSDGYPLGLSRSQK